MEYKEKIQKAEKVAAQFEEKVPFASIRADLKEQGLYPGEIDNVLSSARNILGETYEKPIRQFLLTDKEIKGAPEFSKLSDDLLDDLIEREQSNLQKAQKRKINQLISQGRSPEEVFSQVDTRFIEPEKAKAHIFRVQENVKKDSSGYRIINIAGGLGLLALTAVLAFTIDRLFFVLPIIGVIMIFKGILGKTGE